MEAVTVVIPTYNSGGSLRYTLESLRNSTYTPMHFIIVDGGSTDETKDYLDWLENNVPYMVTIVHDDKEGVVKAFNKGIKKALEHDNEYILLTHDDVVFFKLHKKDWLYNAISIVKKCKTNNMDVITTSKNGMGISGSDYVDGFNWIGTLSLIYSIFDKFSVQR